MVVNLSSPSPLVLAPRRMNAYGTAAVVQKLVARGVPAGGKLEAVLAEARAARDRGESVLVFVEMRATLRLLEAHLTGARHKVFCLLGGMEFSRPADPESTVRSVESEVASFDATEGPAVMLLTLEFGSLGLNLTKANVLLYPDCPYGAVTMLQSQARALRIGQKKKVVRVVFFAMQPPDEKSAVSNQLTREGMRKTVPLDLGSVIRRGRWSVRLSAMRVFGSSLVTDAMINDGTGGPRTPWAENAEKNAVAVLRRGWKEVPTEEDNECAEDEKNDAKLSDWMKHPAMRTAKPYGVVAENGRVTMRPWMFPGSGGVFCLARCMMYKTAQTPGEPCVLPVDVLVLRKWDGVNVRITLCKGRVRAFTRTSYAVRNSGLVARLNEYFKVRTVPQNPPNWPHTYTNLTSTSMAQNQRRRGRY